MSRSSRTWSACLCCAGLCLFAGCGGPGGGSSSTSGSASSAGTLLGKTFTPLDAAFYAYDTGLAVILYDAPGLCADLAANAIKANSSDLVLFVPASAPGTYAGVNVQYAEYDATCNSPDGESGSGTVTITASSASSVSGSFSLSLTADTVTGTFVAPNCPQGSGTSSCR